MTKNSNLDRQHRYPLAVIEYSVNLYLNGSDTYRDVAKKLEAHGIEVSHKTIFEWVQKFGEKLKRKLPKTISHYEIEESETKCNGVEVYMYRAVGKKDETLNVCIKPKKNMAAAKKFFEKSI